MGKSKINQSPKTSEKKYASPQQNKPVYFIICILGLTLFTYYPMFSGQKEFTNWDDDGYVTGQTLVTVLNADNVRKIFEPSSIVAYNYHPLTVLSLAIDYARAYDADEKTLDITPFAVTNLLLHLLNTMLVFMLIYRLSNKQVWVAALAAMLFGIHPMHIESVAWISARKDLLYCFFFVLSLIAYLKYIDSNKLSFLGLSFLLFIASCLSKAMAVPLPFVLLLTDHFLKRRFTLRLLLEKIPFAIVAIIVGVYTLNAQQGAIADEAFTVGQRALIASYAFCMYWFKLILPINLSAFYPYPDFSALPFYYYLTPAIALAIMAVPLSLFIRHNGFSPSLVWGIGFFILMIVLVLQFITVGSSVMNDRYSYVSYIGLFFVFSLLLVGLLKSNRFKTITQVAVVGFIALCTVLSHQRISVWNNSKALWTDVIEKYPIEAKADLSVKTAYKNLADYYASNTQFDSAYVYYKVLTDYDINDAEVWSNMGNIYVLRNNMTEALSAFDRSIFLDTANYETYFKRGIVYIGLQRTDDAVKDMTQVLRLKPDHKEAFALRERFMTSLARK